MPNDQNPEAAVMDYRLQPPRVVLGIDRGYAPVVDNIMAPGERQLVEAAINAGLDMRDADGIRRPCIIPPAVALAVVRMLFNPTMALARVAYFRGQSDELRGTMKATPEIVAPNTMVSRGDNEGGQGG